MRSYNHRLKKVYWVWGQPVWNTDWCVWCLILEIWSFSTWTITSNTIFIAYKLIFIVTGYKRGLRKIENYQFLKYFIKLEIGVCVCVCVCVYVCDFLVFVEETRNWNCLSLPIFTFRVKRQRKDKISVRSCTLVNSARL